MALNYEQSREIVELLINQSIDACHEKGDAE